MANVRLVVKRYMWNYEIDPTTGAPTLAGEAEMRPVESFSEYASPGEALLQAAHNELLEKGMDQSIQRDGEEIIGKKAIKEAAKKLAEHRASAGHESPILDRGRNYDPSGEVQVVMPE
jgi:hypothetical protein